jgi:hypothetical protein
MKNSKTQNKEVGGHLAIEPNSKFIYQGGADVQKTWRKYGWIPPTEYRLDYEFPKNRGDK